MSAVVIPTNLRRSLLTYLLLVEAMSAVDQVVIVATELGTRVPAGCTAVFSEDVFNFHTWVNRGLEVVGSGPTLVLNDDLVMSADSMRFMLRALDDADLVVLPDGRGTTPISGWCYGVHAENPLTRMDETFGWWFGDDDLWQRTAAGGRIEVCSVPVGHDRTDEFGRRRPGYPPRMAAQVRLDRQLYADRWQGGSLEGLGA